MGLGRLRGRVGMRVGKDEMMVRQRHDVAFMVGMLLGACAAACATLFFTPLSGRETRAQLRERYAELRGDDAGVGPTNRP